MVNGNIVRSLILVCVFMALAIDKGLDYVLPPNFQSISIYSMAKYFATAVFIIFTIRSKIFVYLFGIQIISGKYEGFSKEHKTEKKHFESAIITQSILETSISGISKIEGIDDPYSTWSGTLIEYNKAKGEFIFNFSVTSDIIISGILTLYFKENKLVGNVKYFEPNRINRIDMVALVKK